MRARWLARLVLALLHRGLTRAPDFIIGGWDRPYMLRWFVIPRNRFFNIYHHHIRRSDDDRALHDHPWWSLSLVLEGEMVEVLSADGLTRRALSAGDIVLRNADSAHRLELPEGGACKTLFLTGPKIRDWGFHCPKGWKHWRDFVAADDAGSVGPGCDP
ncbi:hypothetical protein BJF92_12100 [Rhizobium rhizosphaerae]|uniref:Cupin domain-containing protein n=1 Tax=Xaviernesmea rhizosphaerae TaxID=1672749 RepID=A0A1Q9ANH3_9HYPH|nr:hypothetical protein BJF92_12100 [Xaviernesmea rhizosphaerae]